MADDFYGYDEEGDEPKGKDNLFLWTVFILLLIGLAFACWLGSFYIFGHPEHPKSYALLMKLHKLDPPRRFEVTAAPPGEFLTAQKIFERYSKLTPLELVRENEDLVRNYLKNYRETKKLVPYLTGRYVILDCADMSSKDMFPTGMVALAQAGEFPQVLIEHVYPAAPKMLPSIRASIQTGNPLKLERTNDLAAVVHIEKTGDGRLLFTVVPLLYGSYGGATAFSLEPPPTLNMVPGLPVMKATVVQEGLKKFAAYRAKHPAVVGDGQPGTTAQSGQEIVRVETVEPGKAVPETGPMPQVPVATPVAIAGRTTTPPPRYVAVTTPPPATPFPHAVTPRALITMVATPTPVPVATPPSPSIASNNTPPRMSPDGVPLKPFVEAKPDRTMTAAGASWRTYAPGQAPAARAISLEEVGPIADRGDVGERLYLRGEFRVTASGTNRAVLRDATKPDDQSPRVVVEYPAGAVPPSERERFVRDNARPYLISDVRRGADGVVTIYVKEIIAQ